VSSLVLLVALSVGQPSPAGRPVPAPADCTAPTAGDLPVVRQTPTEVPPAGPRVGFFRRLFRCQPKDAPAGQAQAQDGFFSKLFKCKPHDTMSFEQEKQWEASKLGGPD